MPAITLPDGSKRLYPQPVTVAEVAAAIGAGLAKAALAGRVDGKLVDTSHLIANDASLAIVTDKDADGVEIIVIRPPTCWPAPSRNCSRGAGNHRSDGRQRLLLRLRLQETIHPRRPGADRAAHGRAGQAGLPGRA